MLTMITCIATLKYCYLSFLYVWLLFTCLLDRQTWRDISFYLTRWSENVTNIFLLYIYIPFNILSIGNDHWHINVNFLSYVVRSHPSFESHRNEMLVVNVTILRSYRYKTFLLLQFPDCKEGSQKKRQFSINEL